jgi:hypothetical protein
MRDATIVDQSRIDSGRWKRSKSLFLARVTMKLLLTLAPFAIWSGVGVVRRLNLRGLVLQKAGA